MKKVLLLLLLILIACGPAPPARPAQPASQPVEPRVVTSEQVVSPPQQPPAPVVEKVEESVKPPTIDLYSQIGCESLLKPEEFGNACGKNAADLVVTYKVGTNNCFVNIKDRLNERLTAGFTLTGYVDDVTAEKEFDRRLVVLKVGADKSVGERAYTSPVKLVDREEMEFLRNQYIVEGGTDTRLCSKDGLLSVMRVADSRIS